MIKRIMSALLCLRVMVVIMGNRMQAGRIKMPGLVQDFSRPRRTGINRKPCGPEPVHSHPADVLQDRPGLADIFTKLIRCLIEYFGMVIAVARELMPFCHDLADQCRAALCNPAQGEKVALT